MLSNALRMLPEQEQALEETQSLLQQGADVLEDAKEAFAQGMETGAM